MQNYNKKSLDSELKTDLITQLSRLRNLLETPPSFSPSERKVIQTMSEGRSPFATKALVYGEKNPSILPPFVDVAELKMDIQAYNDYLDVTREYELFGKKLHDLMFAAGADSFYAALAIYNSAKMAARTGMSEAKPIVDDLKTLFEKQGSDDEAKS
jgi:hypothetical protein